MNSHNGWWKLTFQKENNFAKKSPQGHVSNFDGSMKSDVNITLLW
jgi:hypothetical protein